MSNDHDVLGWLHDLEQRQLLGHLETLTAPERRELLADLAALERDVVGTLVAALRRGDRPDPPHSVEPLPQIRRAADLEADAAARSVGEELLRECRVAAFVVAGGQGTRLGHPGPKGTFPATPIARKPLFALFADKIIGRGARAGHQIPLYVMTGPGNDAETRSFFAKHDHFGLDPHAVFFLTQGTIPAVDLSGELLLESPTRLFRSPDGHGGALRALRTSGALDDMRRRGIEEIFYFQVDNPLVDLCDPTFLGYHHQGGSEFSAKAVAKCEAGEKVGVLARIDGRPGVIEYSDLSEDLREARDSEGNLRLRAGNIAIHALRRDFAERLTSGGRGQLPFHVAIKEVPALDTRGAVVPREAVKFETFIFDAMPLAERTLVMEVDRRDEFSPIKNRDGADSVETSRRDQIELAASWLEAVGVALPRDDAGRSRFAVEISPRFAPDLEALRARSGELPARIEGDLLVEES